MPRKSKANGKGRPAKPGRKGQKNGRKPARKPSIKKQVRDLYDSVRETRTYKLMHDVAVAMHLSFMTFQLYHYVGAVVEKASQVPIAH